MDSNDEKLENNSLLLKYQKAIYEFEKRLEDIKYEKNNNKTRENEGHLINLNNYEEFIKKIQYDKYKNPEYYNNVDGNISESEKIYINQIEFNTYEYFLNMIYNENKYIIINNELWEKVCNKGEENKLTINYEINSYNIYLRLINGKKLVFTNCGDNILESTTCSNVTSDTTNYDEIKNIYNFIKKCSEFEKKFMNDLISSNSNQDDGYFVDKDWIDQWKLYSNYEEIKNNYLEKNRKEKYKRSNNIL